VVAEPEAEGGVVVQFTPKTVPALFKVQGKAEAAVVEVIEPPKPPKPPKELRAVAVPKPKAAPVPARRSQSLTTFSQRSRVREEKRNEVAKALPSWQELQAAGFEIDMKNPHCLRPGKTLANAMKAVKEIGFICSFNEFNGRYMVEGAAGPQELSDQLVVRIRHQVLREFGFDARKDHIRDAIESMCLENGFNPVTEYLDRLEWDGVPRLDSWLARYCKAEPSPLNAAIGRKTLCGMVRRAKQPGCKFDHVLVLEGDEGLQKSGVPVVLAGGPGEGYFSDMSILNANDKEQQELTKGIWCYEIAELIGIRAAGVEKIKQFLSRQSDRARAAYDHYVVNQFRQCVFVGTTNDGKEYLKSQTGNRRWWPVGVGQIDLDALREDRDQLFAEAVVAEPGEELFISGDLFRDLLEVHETRRVKHAWEDELSGLDENEKLVSRYDVEGGIELRIHTKQIFEDVLGKPFGAAHDGDMKRLSQIMQRLGWQKPKGNIRVKQKGRGPAAGYTKLLPLLERNHE
jgi:hypothetical protein